MIPSSDEWDTSNLPEFRRAYLDKQISFEEIAASINREPEILKACTRPIEKAPVEGPKDFRQIYFLIRVREQDYDLFYNAPDGLRGRYWQTPDAGFLATRYLIDLLTLTLVNCAKARPPKCCDPKKAKNISEMTVDDVRTSLRAPSAKVWVREKDDTKQKISQGGPELNVARWAQNESMGTTGRCWRWTPYHNQIEIKGALINSRNVEYIPDIKRDRSCKIHYYGFA
jgi:hypothetical protein